LEQPESQLISGRFCPTSIWAKHYLKSQSVEHQEICRLCRISKTTLTTYLKQYQDGGIERLKEFGYAGPSSQLDEHATTLETYFKILLANLG